MEDEEGRPAQGQIDTLKHRRLWIATLTPALRPTPYTIHIIQRRSDGHDRQLEMQPVHKLKGWAGDTGCGTLRKMIIEKDKSDMRQLSDNPIHTLHSSCKRGLTKERLSTLPSSARISTEIYRITRLRENVTHSWPCLRLASLVSSYFPGSEKIDMAGVVDRSITAELMTVVLNARG